MRTRLELQAMLEELLGSRNVYFQPPESLKINYPCIVYSTNRVGNGFGNNDIYKQDFGYQLVLIDPNPDSEIFKKMCSLPKLRFRNFYISENINHFVFETYLY